MHMIRKLVPVLLAILGTGGGVAAGLMLRPAEMADMPKPETVTEEMPAGDAIDATKDTGNTEFVKLNNQFVIPVVTRDRISAMVVMSLSIEIARGNSQMVYTREPKLRDGFLQVLFDHANLGGFEGEFTNANNMDVLRMSLRDVANRVLGDPARGVLITEIARQDV